MHVTQNLYYSVPQKKIKETDAIFDNIKKKTPKPRHGRTSNA